MLKKLFVACILSAPMLLMNPPRLNAGEAKQRKIYDKCAKACADCQQSCSRCATHCAMLVSKGKSKHLTTLRTCLDCADLCSTAAQIVGRGGPFATLICEACAEACNRCGKECGKFPDSKIMSDCAQECRRCEQACREMLKRLKSQ